MTGLPYITRWRRAWLGTLLLVASAGCGASAATSAPTSAPTLKPLAALCGYFASGSGWWLIAGTVGFCVLQTTLLIGLLANRAKRRCGEAALTADISSLAHELSQPLSAILCNAEAAEIMLQGSAPDLEELRAIIKDILIDDARAGQVINRLRSLLKRRSVDTQPLDLPSVISEVLVLVQADADIRQVNIAFRAMDGLPKVSGDRVLLQQVMLNLLVNAMDALEACAPDQRTIQVSALRLGPACVEVRVVDNGPGIPAGLLKRLFEPFFTTKSTGMGMGLPVSKTIIEAHKGKLWAENGPDGGACFCFTLPTPDPRPLPPDPCPPTPAPRPPTPDP